GADGRFYYVEIMAGGGALFDFDNDGDLDLYVVQGGPIDPGGASGGTDLLFVNTGVADDGRPRFELRSDVGAADGYGMGVAAGDFDGDGWTDLYVTRVGGNVLLRNLEGRRFEDVTELAGVAGNELSSSATFVDLDQDGKLDLYVVNYLRYTLATDKECTDMVGLREYCGPQSYDPEQDRLYRNLGNGRFEDISEAAGIDRAGPGLGVVAGDFDGDGRPDLYVANDQASNHLWLNVTDPGSPPSFRDEAMLRGAALDGRGRAEASMGVDAGDIDGDGDEDLFMTHLIGETNTLYSNDGQGQFEDISLRFSSGRASLPWTGFGCALMDVDLDGRLDLFVANGAVRAAHERRAAGDVFPYQEPDLLFLRSADGDFVDVSERVEGLHPDHVSRGVATGDVDNDGDVDWVVFHAGGPLRLFLNQTLHPHREAPDSLRWLGLDLRTASGSPALGAEVRLYLDDGSVALRTVRAGRGYMTSGDPRLRFGLGEGAEPADIEIRWPDGSREHRAVPPLGSYHRWTAGDVKEAGR
ncbi:MAG: CRTAC1 family protein, partial [Holophagales bacterium]|nr:CRTAC1 family protein [Holophagales bacterium]